MNLIQLIKNMYISKIRKKYMFNTKTWGILMKKTMNMKMKAWMKIK